MQGSPVFKRLSGMSEPVVNKSQEVTNTFSLLILFNHLTLHYSFC